MEFDSNKLKRIVTLFGKLAPGRIIAAEAIGGAKIYCASAFYDRNRASAPSDPRRDSTTAQP